MSLVPKHNQRKPLVSLRGDTYLHTSQLSSGSPPFGVFSAQPPQCSLLIKPRPPYSASDLPPAPFTCRDQFSYLVLLLPLWPSVEPQTLWAAGHDNHLNSIMLIVYGSSYIYSLWGLATFRMLVCPVFIFLLSLLQCFVTLNGDH